MSDSKPQTTVVWPPLIRRCVVDLAKIIETKPPAAFDLMAARLQTLLDTTATDVAYRRGFEDGLAAAAAYIERIGSYGSEHQAANILLLEPEAESDAKQS